MTPPLSASALAVRYALVFAALHLVFALFPAIDLRVADLFYVSGGGFVAGEVPGLNLLRRVIWDAAILAAIAGLVVFAASFLPLPWFAKRRRLAAFVLSGFLLGPGLVVNGVLKAFWGRARPSQILEFGGAAQFTPPVQIADQCARNCSFVSGEASGVTMLAIAIGVVLWPGLGPRARMALIPALGVLVILGSGLRVAMGGHFLSDVLFAILITTAIAHALYRALRPGAK